MNLMGLMGLKDLMYSGVQIRQIESYHTLACPRANRADLYCGSDYKSINWKALR